MYFFEESLGDAWEWVTVYKGVATENAVVIACDLRIKNCIDLLQKHVRDHIKETLFPKYRRMYREAGEALPSQVGEDHYLDCDFFNYLCTVEANRGNPVGAIRGAFGRKADGKIEYLIPGSELPADIHIQIALRDQRAIEGEMKLLDHNDVLIRRKW